MRPWATPQEREIKEKYMEMTIADVQDEKYQVNYCSEREEIPYKVERRWSKMEWSRVSKAADRSRRQR